MRYIRVCRLHPILWRNGEGCDLGSLLYSSVPLLYSSVPLLSLLFPSFMSSFGFFALPFLLDVHGILYKMIQEVPDQLAQASWLLKAEQTPLA